MPPKKDNKKQAASKPDNSGIPKRDIQFKFSFSIRSESSQAPNIAVMFEWFAGISDKFQRNELPLLESWKKDQNIYSFQKQCDIIRVDDDFCKALSNRRFYLYFVNGQDNKVQDKLMIDYSSLLTASSPVSYSLQSNIIRVLGIDSFNLKVTADKPLLQDIYKHYLNPLEVEVIGSKDLPVEKSSRYEPTYVKFGFFDGTEAETPGLVGSDKLLWSHKHVFLAGLMNPVELKQKMRSRYLKFQLHDRDEIMNKKGKPEVQLFDISKAIQQELQKEKPVEQDPKKKGAKKQQKKEVKKQVKKDTKKKDAKLGQPILPQKLDYQRNNYGVAAFSLVQFLKPSTKNARYKAPVVPRNAYEDLQSKNLDLNTTARNQMHNKVITSNNYFDCDTVLVVGFTLAYAIGTFQPPEIKQEVVQDPKKKKDPKEVVPVADKKEEKKVTTDGDVFERIVYVVPYKDSETIKTIEDVFYTSNLKAFELKNKREITTHLLSEQQKNSKTLDYITGLQICDPEGRLFILEGLRKGAMREFAQKIVRSAPNSKQFKILKNINVGFSKRLFSAFNIQLKRIRLRPSLSQLLLEPSIYIKSKVDQRISQTLVKLNDARKIPDSLLSFQAMNLWPNAQALLEIQRKFSQSLSNQDITGAQNPRRQTTFLPGQTSKTVKLYLNTDVNIFTNDEFFYQKEVKVESPKIQNMTNTNKRFVQTKSFTKDNFKANQTYKMRGQRVQHSDQPVYIYAGQKLNFYQKQMKQFREKMQPNAVYTYDADYFRLAIDPHTIEEEKKKQLQMSMSKMYSKDKFSSLLVKTKDQRMKIPNKPSQQDILDLINYPYHEQMARQKELTRNARDLPLKGDKEEFKKYGKPLEIFSTFQPVQGEKLSPVQQQKIQKQLKKRHKEEQKQLLKGTEFFRFKKGYSGQKTYGIDRLKDIREGDAKKIGFIDKKKEGQVRKILPYESSLYLSQNVGDPAFNPLIRIDDPTKNIQKDQFNFYQRPQILTRTQVYKPLKDIL